jgi:hypothetical protein
LIAEGFFCSLGVFYGGLRISKLQFLIKKRYKKLFSCIFFLLFLVIKTQDPYPDMDSLEMVDPDPCPDPDSINPDPQLCLIVNSQPDEHMKVYFSRLYPN